MYPPILPRIDGSLAIRPFLAFLGIILEDVKPDVDPKQGVRPLIGCLILTSGYVTSGETESETRQPLAV